MKRDNKNTILITGGGGLIGSSLIYALQDKYNIICLDRGGARPEFKNLFDRHVKFIKGEITGEALLDKVARSCSVIIHLAGGGGNQACLNDPVWAVRTHILGTDLLLKKALKYKIKKFIFASSQSVYTTFHKRAYPFKENMNLEPDDFYGMLKKSAEDLIKKSGINYIILRFANIYGQSDFMPLQAGGAINNFIKSASAKKIIQIFGTGKQGIDHVNLTDVVKAIELAVKEKGKKQIYNVGGGELAQIKKIAETIRDIFRKNYNEKIIIKNLSAPADKIWPNRLMSINKIKKDLSWEPEVSLKNGLEEMIINYRENI